MRHIGHLAKHMTTFEATFGRRLRILLGHTQSGRNERLHRLASEISDCGADVEIGARFDSLDIIYRQAIDSDCHAVGIFQTDDQYIKLSEMFENTHIKLLVEKETQIQHPLIIPVDTQEPAQKYIEDILQRLIVESQ